MHRPLLVIAVVLLTAGAAWGQSSPPPDQTEQVRILLERIQQLEKRVAEVESKLEAATIPSLSASSTSPQQQTAPRPAAALSRRA